MDPIIGIFIILPIFSIFPLCDTIQRWRKASWMKAAV